MKTYCDLSYEIYKSLGCEVTLEHKESPTQLFYSITQVAKKIGVQPHVIRYWEKHFQVLNPQRGSSSNWRNYSEADIKSLEQIKLLVNDKGLTISGAIKAMQNKKSSILTDLEEIMAELEAI